MSDTKTTDQDIRDQVAQRYGEIATTGGASCCGGGPEGLGMIEHAKAIGYESDDLETLPEGANLGLGMIVDAE